MFTKFKQLFNFVAKKKFLLVLIVFILIGGFFVRSTIFAPKTLSESITIKRGYISQQITLSGKIEAENDVVLQFPTAGKIGWVGVKEGDWVQKYQSLASLDLEKFQASLRQEEQDFIAAKAEHEKYYDGRTGDSESYDQRITRTALDAKQNKAYDDLRMAQENLKDATLFSPIDGLAVRVDPIQGTIISSVSQGQIEIVDPNTIYFSVAADQTEVVNLKEGQSVKITLDSYLQENIEGTIKSISFIPKSDETGTVYEVKVRFNSDNSNYKYRLGMTGDAVFVTQTRENSLYLPLKYVNSDKDGSYVFKDNNQTKQYVEVGLETDFYIEILKGMNEGDLVYD